MRQGLYAAALAAILVAGCNQPRDEGAAGGGGGQAPRQETRDQVQQTRDHLGEAYVQAAQTHASVVRGDYQGAVNAIKNMRSDLSQAKQASRLATQTRINELDQEAIRVQREIEQRSVNSYQATKGLVDRTERLFVTLVPPSHPGGGGAGGIAPEPPAQEPGMAP